MKTVAAAVLLMLLCPTLTAGQTPQTKTQERAIRQGRTKIWTGIAMVAAGAVMLPITSSGSDSRDETKTVTALGLMGVGSGVIYWGFWQQQKAVRPSNAFGVTVGRTNAVVLRRSW